MKKETKVKLSETIIREECIADAINARKIKKAFSSILQGAHLNYTGGTKVMATYACMAFKKNLTGKANKNGVGLNATPRRTKI